MAIAKMSYGRDATNKMAITVLNLEKDINPSILKSFEKIEEITALHLVRL